MTKIKASSASKSAAEVIVLGFDEQFEPFAARFAGAKHDVVTKAAHRIGFKAYSITSRDLATLARKLPEGQLNSKGAMTVPKVPQSLYSDFLVALVADPKQAIETADQASALPTAIGLPPDWDQIAPGHLRRIRQQRGNVQAGARTLRSQSRCLPDKGAQSADSL